MVGRDQSVMAISTPTRDIIYPKNIRESQPSHRVCAAESTVRDVPGYSDWHFGPTRQHSPKAGEEEAWWLFICYVP